jgi:hypothetical protein
MLDSSAHLVVPNKNLKKLFEFNSNVYNFRDFREVGTVSFGKLTEVRVVDIRPKNTMKFEVLNCLLYKVSPRADNFN